MCGRFAFFSPVEAIQALFDVTDAPALEPRYNIAPSQAIAVLRGTEAGGTELAQLRWGLVPSWAKDPGIGNRLINARAETVAEKPAFRAAYRRRRCAILADGFYEWQAVAGGPKQPWFITVADQRPFLMAGIWEHWEKGPEPLFTCAIITRQANAGMARVHHRMPVILAAGALDAWLHGSDAEPADRCLQADAPELAMHPVSRAVNSPANDGPDLIRSGD